MFLDLEKVPGQNIAVISDDGEQITYDELTDFSLGIGRCLMFILCENTVESLLGYVYCLNNRVVPLLLDSKIDRVLLLNLIKTYSPQYIWLPKKANTFSYGVAFEYKNYVLLETQLTPFKLHDELALLLTTSGSTGSPKLVRQSYKNIFSNAEAIAEYLEIDQYEKPITSLPMNYTYGLSIINSHLLKGAAILLTNKTLMQREFWSFFMEEGATSIAGVPYTYEILKKLRFFKMSLPSLKTMTQAGGRLSPELHREFAEYARNTGRRFFVMYGATEATARMSYLPNEKSMEKCGSIGIAIPGGQLYVVDSNGQIIDQPDCVGELVYKGRNVTLGYAECSDDLAKGDEFNGVLFTGDMAKMDSEGYFYIVGRKKRFVKIFGNRVNLDECEGMIRAFFNVECACVGTDDNVCVYITDEGQVESVHRFISEKTGLNSIAFKVKTISSIPKNEAGKVVYSRLKND